MRRRAWTLVILITVVVSTVMEASAQQKKRVAVFDFEYGTVSSSVAALFGSNVDVGKGIADLIVENLVKSGVYSVIERKALEKILAEQNLSNSDRADPNSAAKLGKILGVDGIVIGSITQFGSDDKSTNVSGGAIGGLTGRFGIGGVSRRNSKAAVNISARMVGTETAEIYAVASGKGESQRSGTSLLGASGSGGGAFDMTSSNFRDTIIGEAVIQAVDMLSKELDAESAKILTKKIEVDGLVADATGGVLVLNVGTTGGVQVGQTLAVKRTSREIKDPATGKVIRRIEETVGEVVITEADASSAMGNFKGTGAPKVGDRVASLP